VDGDNRDVGDEAGGREREQPGEAVAMGAPGGPFEVSAYPNEGCGEDQDPYLLAVHKLMELHENVRQQHRPSGRARGGGGDQGERRQPAAERVQADHGRVGDVRVLPVTL